MTGTIGDSAIVIGGSMAGLLAARVLSERFNTVTILERDEFPARAENRRGVPQGRHTHGLLASGGLVLEQLFPGITDELGRTGAPQGDIASQSRYFLEGGLLCRVAGGLRGTAVSRPCLEFTVRNRVLALPNVRVRQGVQVIGLHTDGAGRVIGVQSRDETVAADLTVDACGRGSRATQWLQAMGYPAPREETVEIGLSYCTRLFRRKPTDLGGDIATIIPPTPEGKRGGVMLAQEGDRWTVTLISHFVPPAPERLDGFIEFTRTLPGPFIYDIVRQAEPIGDAVTARFPASLRRHYEELKRFPDGYLVFGDAISSFNPIYGQGMSAAALQSMELRACLESGLTGLAPRFFARASKVTDGPWMTAVGNDLRMKETVGPRSAATNVINWYMSKLLRCAHHDPELALAFHRVGNLLAPPPSVLHPRLISRVIAGSLRRRPEEATPKSLAGAAGASR